VEPLPVSFVGGDLGTWGVERIDAVRGEGLPVVPRLAVLEGGKDAAPRDFAWVLRGVTSNERYTAHAEQQALRANSPPLGRNESTFAALIPISKSAEWWALAQDERRAIFEDRSRHIATSLDYLPRIARRLHHGRDLGEEFHFLTWFEYSPDDAAAFEELVNLLRATEEWTYVSREVDIRIRKRPA
jgi:chlorite dismutase